MKLIKLLLLINFVMFSIAFNTAGDKFRQVKDVDTFKEKIQTYTSENTSIQSDFIQEKHLTILEEVLISKGHFSFQKENNVRWEYNEPIDYAIIVYNGLFTIWDGKKIQEYNIESNRMFSEINNMIVTSVSGNFLDNPDFESDYFENDTYYLIKLTPLKPEVNDMLSGIEIYFDKSNFSVSKVIFNEPGDDYTLISFSNIKFNQEIPAQVFKTDFD